MLRIRMRRVGGKKQPSYRMVVAESTAPRDGKFVEVVGFHNPRMEPEIVQIKEDRVLHWLSVGAQPSDAVTRLLKRTGTLARFERMKGGESLESLVVEAAAVAQTTSLKTDHSTTQNVEPVTESDDRE
ncbi:MAG: 30S ribosomal protein S16 [Anaerolineae bacterium]